MYKMYLIYSFISTSSDDTDAEICDEWQCADHKPPVGSYCGRGPCNIFGCNCDGGCIGVIEGSHAHEELQLQQKTSEINNNQIYSYQMYSED